jgi:multicomponent K+:H+ antiporter subunit D
MGSALFWSPQEVDPAIPLPQDRGGIAAVLLCLAALVALTVFAGPIMAWLTVAAENLHAPAAYIAANSLRGGT